MVAPSDLLADILGDDLGIVRARALHQAHCGVTFRLGHVVHGQVPPSRGGARRRHDPPPLTWRSSGVWLWPRTDLAEAAGGSLQVDKGIVVDDRLRTSDPAIWPAGDSAR